MAATEELVTDVVIPVRDCQKTLAAAVAAVPRRHVRSVVVVDRGSMDQSPQIARDSGAVVLRSPDPGYGAAIRCALAHLERLPRPPDVVAFCAGDGSDDPGELPQLLAPIQHDNAELVVGVRGGHKRARRLGTKVALGLIGAIYRHRFEDIGPFRAIRLPALVAMGLTDSGDGYPIEMLVKALNLGLQIVELPVTYIEPAQSRPLAEKASRASRALLQILKHSTTR